MNNLTAGCLPLFRIAGIQVYLHWTWLAVAYFEIVNRVNKYQSMTWNVIEYLALFGIVLLHEFGHALACRQVGGQANRIMLWPLGGVAFVQPPPRPGALLWSIAAGPLVNVILLPVTFIARLIASRRRRLAERATRTSCTFCFPSRVINLVLLVFNLMPIYPLDGGQILQALLWFVIGRARSLMVSGIIGLAAAAGVIVLALVRLSGQMAGARGNLRRLAGVARLPVGRQATRIAADPGRAERGVVCRALGEPRRSGRTVYQGDRRRRRTRRAGHGVDESRPCREPARRMAEGDRGLSRSDSASTQAGHRAQQPGMAARRLSRRCSSAMGKKPLSMRPGHAMRRAGPTRAASGRWPRPVPRSATSARPCAGRSGRSPIPHTGKRMASRRCPAGCGCMSKACRAVCRRREAELMQRISPATHQPRGVAASMSKPATPQPVLPTAKARLRTAAGKREPICRATNTICPR